VGEWRFACVGGCAKNPVDAFCTSASRDRLSTASLLARIAEFDARKHYRPAAYPSMFAYCVGQLHFSEDAAAKRIHAALTARAFPALFPAVADGRLHLSGVVLLAPHLTVGNAEELLAAASHRSKAASEQLIAQRFPACDANGLAAQGATPAPDTHADLLVTGSSGAAAETWMLANVTKSSSEHAPGHVEAPAECDTAAPFTAPALHATLKPVAPGRHQLVAVISQEACEQLLGSKELLGHAIPSGALVEVLQRAISLQFARLRKRRCAATERPRHGAPHRSSNPRHVPAEIVRAVWERDGSQCAFVAASGHRCESRDRLELDHVVPVARGGRSTVENLRRAAVHGSAGTPGITQRERSGLTHRDHLP
jgi:5-methylcytosine-specific restriction endonuclease McrA